MAAPRAGKFVIWMTRGAAAIAFVVFLSTAFRTGWTQSTTDFPNYYAAAVLVRQHKPLRSFYDWTWFAQQMNYAGVERQLGAYTAQTPLTMLPMVGLAGLPVQSAKRVWLGVSLGLLTLVFYMLARATGISFEQIALLGFCGFSSLAANFVTGQYYVFLLFLIALAFYLLSRDDSAASGFISGGAFALKLYTGPLLLYFAAKRKWRGVAGMLIASVCGGALAVALFGRGEVGYYLTHVLPRALEGGPIDPYNPGTQTISTLLRRLLIREPQLNPNPALQSPGLFFFTRTAVQFSLIAFATLGIAWRKNPLNHRDFAWFVIVLILLSTNTASYTFVLLLVPVALLLKDASAWKAAYLVGSYILLNANLKPVWLFPKVWLLLLLFAVTGLEFWRAIPIRWTVCAALAIVAISLADARRHMLDFSKEPGRRYEQIAVEPGSLLSAYPVITRAGLFFQCMGDERKGEDGYMLCWSHDGRLDRFGFGGYALHPLAATTEGPVWFQLVAHRTAATMRFDPSTRTAMPSPLPAAAETGDLVVSPNRQWAAFTRTTSTSEQLWIRNLATGVSKELAGGSCDNSTPVWELDSSAIIFASDCGRGPGLSALYRAPIGPQSTVQ